MLSLRSLFRRRPKPDPVELMLEQWRETAAQREPRRPPLPLSQLQLLALMLKRP